MNLLKYNFSMYNNYSELIRFARFFLENWSYPSELGEPEDCLVARTSTKRYGYQLASRN